MLRRDNLDDTHSHLLFRVTDSETAMRQVLHKRLNPQRLRRDAKGKRKVAVLDVLGLSLELLARAAVKLLQQLVELARNVPTCGSQTLACSPSGSDSDEP